MLAEEAKVIGFDEATSGRNLGLKHFSREQFRLQCHHLVLDNSVTVLLKAVLLGRAGGFVPGQGPIAMMFAVPEEGEIIEVTMFLLVLSIFLQ